MTEITSFVPSCFLSLTKIFEETSGLFFQANYDGPGTSSSPTTTIYKSYIFYNTVISIFLFDR